MTMKIPSSFNCVYGDAMGGVDEMFITKISRRSRHCHRVDLTLLLLLGRWHVPRELTTE
jgi:hypothetical protein